MNRRNINLLQDTAGNAAATLGLVVAGIIAIVIGVLIWYKLDTALFTAGTPAAPTAASSAAYNATYHAQVAVWNSTNATANSVWTLMPIIAIVIIAGVILAVVMGFGRSQM